MSRRFGYTGTIHHISIVPPNGRRKRKSHIPFTYSSLRSMGSSFASILKNTPPTITERPSDTNPDSMLRRRVDFQSTFSASDPAMIKMEYNKQNAPSITALKKQNSFRPSVTLTVKNSTTNRNITLTTRAGITGSISTLHTHANMMTNAGISTPEITRTLRLFRRKSSLNGRKIYSESGIMIDSSIR